MFIVYIVETGEMLSFFQFQELKEYTSNYNLYNGQGMKEIKSEADITDEKDIIATYEYE